LIGDKPRNRAIIPILLVGLALRLYVAATAAAIELDGIGYATMADNFAKGLFGRAMESVFPPVYPLFVALFHLAIPDVEVAGRIVSLAFGVLLIYLSFLFARRFFRDEGKALWAALLVALQPYLVRYSGAVLSEACTTFLFSATVFSFYMAWQEKRRRFIGISGLCLALTYLTRPEYLVFYAPFIVCLLARRRFLDSLLFFLPFLFLGFFYMGCLWWQTGVWAISRKAMLSPFVPLRVVLGNTPLVAYEFFIAVFPLFFLLAVLGYTGIKKPYRRLVLLLAATHIASLSFVGHATQRYSVEFVPACMVLAAEGIYAAGGYIERRFPGRAWMQYAMVAIILCAGVSQSFTPFRYERMLHKRAGLFLLSYDPGSVVASRLPLVAFYEKGSPVDLFSAMSGDNTKARFEKVVSEKKVRYLIFDEKVELELPFLKDCLSRATPVYSARSKGTFVRVYRM
jgi:hypothetical protein